MGNNVVLNNNLENTMKARFREKEARLQAESLLEAKTRELYQSNQELLKKYAELERQNAEISLFLSLSKFSQREVTTKTTLQFFIDSICNLENWPVAHVLFPNQENKNELVSSGIWHLENEIKYYDLKKETTGMTFKEGKGSNGIILNTTEPLFIYDIEDYPFFIRSNVCKKLGLKSSIGLPIKCYGELIAIVEFFFTETYERNNEKEELLLTFVSQLETLLERHKAQEEARDNNFKLQQALVELQNLAHNDTLTHLANRLQFELTLQRDLASAKRYNTKLALLYIDLDNFKNVNDQLGHDVGDLLLIEAANRFQSCIRGDDFAARLGGDEFAIIAKVKTPQDAEVIAEKIIKQMSKSVNLNGHPVSVSASIGIACYPESGLDQVTLCKNADIALYKVKANGRNGYLLFDVTLQSQYKKRLDIESSIDFAQESNQLSLVYQPIYKLQNNKALGMEVLLRWTHPIYGNIPPDEFIPIAEEKGTIVQIGEWILRTACAQFVEWNTENNFDLTLLINISARQLKDKNFLKMVKKVVEETKMPIDKLEFEITETAVMSNQYECEEVLKGLQELGIKIAIDDFGTGYSSLNRLKMLPISALKIDRSFIKDIGEKDNNDLIIKSIISLAKELHLNTIAEGVETEEQKQFLLENKCPNVQGYYFNQPLNDKEMKEFLRTYHDTKNEGNQKNAIQPT